MENKENKEQSSTIAKKFAYDDTTVSIIKYQEDRIKDLLEPRVYTLKYHPMMGFYLKIKYDLMPIESVVFGSAVSRAEKVIHTYLTRDKKTGVLFTGQKGSGKTLTMNMIANIAISRLALPVIVIEDKFVGSSFVDFIEDLGECVVIFDEFAKTYRGEDNESDQEKLLGLFDGISKAKRLILATENDEKQINEFFIARPGRFYYHFKYGKLESSMISDVCGYHKINDAATKEIINIARGQSIFSFNILDSIIQEHQRYPDEKINELVKEMNIGVTPVRLKLKVIDIFNKITGEKFEVPLMSAFIDAPTNQHNSTFKFAHTQELLNRQKERFKEHFTMYEHGYRKWNIGINDIVAEYDNQIVFEDEIDNQPIVFKCEYLSEDESKQAEYSYFG